MAQLVDLEQMARVRFGALSDAEIRLLRAAPRGEIAYCGPSKQDDDPNNDPLQSDKWSRERWIRADVVRWLSVNRDARDNVDPGGIQVHAARIEGPLDLSFVIVPFHLSLDHCGFSANVDLSFIEVPCLEFLGCCLAKLRANYAAVRGSVWLHNLRSTGVEIRGAQIGGDLSCCGSKFQNPAVAEIDDSGIALDAQCIKVRGGVLLKDEFAAVGAVWLLGGEIGAHLECAGNFQNPVVAKVVRSGTALYAEGAKITGEVALGQGFAAAGVVSFLNAEIGGNLNCEGGKFENATVEDNSDSGVALVLDGAKVAGGVFMRDGFAAEGEVRLNGAQIGGKLECEGGTFRSLNLMNAVTGGLMDDEKGWPTAGSLFLDGFTYGCFFLSPATARQRLKWLARQALFTRQPYRQLAKVLKDAGDDRGRRQVCAEMEKRIWAGRRWPVRLLSYLLQATIGYGYFSLRALWWLAALVVIGAVIYGRGYQAGNMVPTEKDAYERFVDNKPLPGEYEAFYALPYSLENCFPVVKLGVQDKWMPASSLQGRIHQPIVWRVHLLSYVAVPSFLRCFRWFQICAGWILATLFVGGVTGLVRQD